MLTLINSNRMSPPIGPIGLEYVAGAARRAGVETRVVDLCLAEDPDSTLRDHFAGHQPRLVGVSFRNGRFSTPASQLWKTLAPQGMLPQRTAPPRRQNMVAQGQVPKDRAV